MTHGPVSHPDADIARAIRITRIITFAFSAGVVVFAAVVVLLIRDGGFATASAVPADILPWAAAVGALVLVVAPRLGGLVAGSGNDTRMARMQSFSSGRLLMLALQEGVGLMGLVLGLLSGSIPWALAFAAASVTAMLLSMPSEESLRQRLRGVSR